MIRRLIRSDGVIKAVLYPFTRADVARLIGADTLNTVSLADGLHVMLVDDSGIAKCLPVNAEATRLYLQRCREGTTYQILGDVVILPDRELA